MVDVSSTLFTVRTANALKNAGIKTIADFIKIKDVGIIRSGGRKSLNEVKDVLGQYGLQLASS